MECSIDNFLLNPTGIMDAVESFPRTFIHPVNASRVDYAFVAMEPSLRGLRHTSYDKRTAEKLNFVLSKRDLLLHLFIRKRVGAKSYCIMDIAKGPMSAQDASRSRIGRWIRWYPVFIDEMGQLVHTNTRVIALGRTAFDAIYYSDSARRLSLQQGIGKLTHYANRFPKAQKRLSKKLLTEYRRTDMNVFARQVLSELDLSGDVVDSVSRKVTDLNDKDIELLACWQQEF